MPLVNGPIEPGGAVVQVLVGVSRRWEQLLRKRGRPVPFGVPVRALIDTGASISGFAPQVFTGLGLTPVARMAVLTPSTPSDRPFDADLYDVTLSLVANARPVPFTDCRVMAADCWLPGEGIEALIGRDILNHCHLMYYGPERAYALGFGDPA